MRPFFKVSTTFPENPKILAAGPMAGWLYLCTLAYCARNTTDGFFRMDMLGKLSNVKYPKQSASKLVELGLWHLEGHECPKCPPCGHGQGVVHDYSEHQQSAAHIASVRSQRAVAGKRGGEAKARNRENANEASSKLLENGASKNVPEVEVEVEEETPKVKTNTAPRKRAARKKTAPAQEPIPLPVAAEETDPLELKAREVLAWWWEQQTPRPAGKNAWHAGHAVILGLLRAGHEPKAVAAAAREIGSPLTIARMEISLNRGKASMNGHKPSTTDSRVAQALELAEYYRQRGE